MYPTKDLLVNWLGGIASKPDFLEPGIYHEKRKGRNHETKILTAESQRAQRPPI
jgi:hypothetical protein